MHAGRHRIGQGHALAGTVQPKDVPHPRVVPKMPGAPRSHRAVGVGQTSQGGPDAAHRFLWIVLQGNIQRLQQLAQGRLAVQFQHHVAIGGGDALRGPHGLTPLGDTRNQFHPRAKSHA